MNPWPGIALCVVAAVVLWFWFARAQRGDEERRLKSAAGAEAAERLIRYELSKSPGLSRPEAARRARERLEADRLR